MSSTLWGKLANSHLVAVLFATFGVFAYRDLWPLATYTKSIPDAAEGWLMWAKLSTLFTVAVCIPLVIPRTYTPLDPSVSHDVSLP